MKNKVHLIAYVDRFGGGGLTEFRELLAGPLRGVFGAVHLLPFFNPIDGADAGFDPIDHTQVDPRLGQWRDIKDLSSDVEVMADVIVNHVSDRSPQFLDYSLRGSASHYSGLFLTRDSVFPTGISSEELAAIYRPRPGSPFVDVTLQSGEQVTLWVTFTPHQLDIDVCHPLGKSYLKRVLATLAENGVTIVRLDAVGYAIKRAGTSCFMLPETFDFIDDLAADARASGIEVLVEVHSYFGRQIEIAAHVDWVYDFALPPLLLHAFGRRHELVFGAVVVDGDFDVELFHQLFDGGQLLLRGRADDGGEAAGFGILEGAAQVFGLLHVDVAAADQLDAAVAKFLGAFLPTFGRAVLDGEVEFLHVRVFDVQLLNHPDGFGTLEAAQRIGGDGELDGAGIAGGGGKRGGRGSGGDELSTIQGHDEIL